MGINIVGVDIIVNLFLALLIASSSKYIATGNCEFNAVYFLTALVLFIFLLICNEGLRYFISNYYNKTAEEKIPIPIIKWLFFSKWSLFRIAILIFFLWAPILIALYPGTLINDSWGQLQQFMMFTENGVIHRNVLTDHHPFFDTLFMGILIVPFAKSTGFWHISIFAYVLLQAAITSLTFSYSVLYIYKKLKIGLKPAIGMLLVYSFLPVYASSVQTVSKDALFSWIFVLFFIFYMEVVRTNGSVLDDNGFFIKFIASLFFCIVTKKVGFYVVSMSMVSLYLTQIYNKKKVLIGVIISFSIMCIMLPGMRTILDIQPGGIQEMFSMPFQQTARFVKYHPDEVTEEEKKAIDKVLGYQDLAQRYNPLFADPVKGYSQKGTFKDYILYLKVWAYEGCRHPETYINATTAMISGWFSFSEYAPLMSMEWHSQLDTKLIPEEVSNRGNFFTVTATNFQSFFDEIYKVPFLLFFYLMFSMQQLFQAF